MEKAFFWRNIYFIFFPLWSKQATCSGNIILGMRLCLRKFQVDSNLQELGVLWDLDWSRAELMSYQFMPFCVQVMVANLPIVWSGKCIWWRCRLRWGHKMSKGDEPNWIWRKIILLLHCGFQGDGLICCPCWEVSIISGINWWYSWSPTLFKHQICIHQPLQVKYTCRIHHIMSQQSQQSRHSLLQQWSNLLPPFLCLPWYIVIKV